MGQRAGVAHGSEEFGGPWGSEGFGGPSDREDCELVFGDASRTRVCDDALRALALVMCAAMLLPLHKLDSPIAWL